MFGIVIKADNFGCTIFWQNYQKVTFIKKVRLKRVKYKKTT